MTFLFTMMGYSATRWRARRGLRDGDDAHDPESELKVEDRSVGSRTGVRGETYAYWYLRRHGYVFVARNYSPRGMYGEVDLIGYDGDMLVFVEVRTRTATDGLSALPELSVTREKERVVARTAQMFLAERGLQGKACRFDVIAIENRKGEPPVVRLHKDAFSPQM